MITFLAFLITVLGCVNWLMIGLLQYDFVAGIFGWQSSIMSRLVYIIFGVACVYLVLRVIVNKGSFKVWEKRKKKEKKEAISQGSAPQFSYAQPITPPAAQTAVTPTNSTQQNAMQASTQNSAQNISQSTPQNSQQNSQQNAVQSSPQDVPQSIAQASDSANFQKAQAAKQPQRSPANTSEFQQPPSASSSLFDEHLGQG